MSKVALNDENLDQVVGGLMRFNYRTQVMTYTHEDGTQTTHNILDFDNAWDLSNELHAKNIHEDNILKALKDQHYIE